MINNRNNINLFVEYLKLSNGVGSNGGIGIVYMRRGIDIIKWCSEDKSVWIGFILLRILGYRVGVEKGCFWGRRKWVWVKLDGFVEEMEFGINGV